MQRLLAAIHGNPEAMDTFVGVYTGTVSPAEFFDPRINKFVVATEFRNNSQRQLGIMVA
jgi:hypothetical protein